MRRFIDCDELARDRRFVRQAMDYVLADELTHVRFGLEAARIIRDRHLARRARESAARASGAWTPA